MPTCECREFERRVRGRQNGFEGTGQTMPDAQAQEAGSAVDEMLFLLLDRLRGEDRIQM